MIEPEKYPELTKLLERVKDISDSKFHDINFLADIGARVINAELEYRDNLEEVRSRGRRLKELAAIYQVNYSKEPTHE